MFGLYKRKLSNDHKSAKAGTSTRLAAILALSAGLFLANPAGIVSSSGLPATAGGVIAGQFATTPTGAATFNVPIQVPPGIQGLQPSLGLVYNSQNTRNGLTGVGWQLTGLPDIERCGKRRTIDGLAAGVTFTNADRLCMNGVPLLPKQPIANDNDYWSQSGRTYGKELEDRISIRPAHGIANGGPWELQATHPDGRIMYYGGHTGARIRSANGNQKVRQWLLREIRDRNGNSIHYTYAHDRGHARISRIDYAGRSVQFDYTQTGARDHVIRSTGNEIKHIRHRLDRIRISTAESSSFKTYHLSYGLSNSSSRSRLERIEECDPNSCLEPLELTWNDTPPLNGSFRKVHTPGYQYQLWLRSDFGVNIIPGDFNGDGKTDFIRQTKNEWDDSVYTGNFMVWFSNGDGTFNYVFPEDGGKYQDLLRHDPGARLITGDYNGDGKTDFIRMPRNGWGNFSVYFSRGDGYFDIATTNNSAHQAWLRDDRANYYTGDFNGDGKTDFLRQEKGAWDDTINWGNFLVFFSKGDGTFNHVNPGQGTQGDKFQDWLRADPGALIIVGDYDGDGMSDFVRQEHSSWDDDSSNTFMVYFSKGNGDFKIVTPPNQTFNQTTGAYTYQDSMRFDSGVNLIPGDFNGDGKTDLLRQEKGGWGEDAVNTVQVCLSLGNGRFSVVTQNEAIVQNSLRTEFTHQIIPLDYNGDGRMDFLRQEVGGIWAFLSKLYVYVSRGDGYFDRIVAPGPQTIKVPYQNGVNIIPGDFDGDGRSDFIGQDHSAWDDDLNDNFRVYFAGLTANSAPIETIARIQQGTVTHDMTYRRLSEYALHDENQQTNASFRRMEGGTLAVLRTYSRRVPTAVESGMAEQVVNRTYDFKNPFVSTEGRGFLGFSKLTIHAPEEGERITERYGTHFPFTGKLLNRHTANYATGQAISYMDYQWRGAAIPMSASNHGYAYALQIVRSEGLNYVNGSNSSFQRTRTDVQYDSFGNPALVTDTDGGRTLQTCSEYNNSSGLPGPITKVVQGTGCSVSNNTCSCSTRLTEVRQVYDSKSNIIQRKQYDSARNDFLTTAYTYDSHGNRTSTTLPTGAVETVSYESTYNTYPETITTAFDGKTLSKSQTYDARHGLPIDDVDANGAITRRAYDNFGRLVSVHKTGPQGLVLVESHSYARQGDTYTDVIATRQSWDSATMIPAKDYRDGLGRVTREQVGPGSDQKKVISIYSARGDLIQKSIPYRSGSNPGWTRYSFNYQHRVSQIEHPTGATSTLTYAIGGVCDADHWRISTVTSGGAGRNSVRCENARGKVEKLVMTDASSGTSTTQTFTLDPLDRLVAVGDGQATTNFNLDSLGRRTALTSSDRGTTEYFYDAAGQLSIERMNGEDRTFAYDALGRETGITYHDGSSAEFEYDDAAFVGGKGRLTRAIMRSSNGTETSRREFAYDADGNPSVVHLSMDGGSGGSHTMQYKHDPQGRPQAIHYPGGRVACYAYDPVGNLSEIKVGNTDCADPQAQVFAAYSGYTAQGQPGRVVYGNGVTTDFTYDNLNRVATVETLDSDSVALLNQQYTWTPMHEVQAIDDRAGDNDAVYTYNAFGYLTRAVGSYGDIAYEYNPGGNLTKKGDLNISYAGSRPTGADNGLALTYDSHGNVTQRDRGDGNVFQFTYDGRHKIKQVAKNGVQAGRYEYDGFGDRVKKVDGNGTETIYVNRELEITRFAGGRLLSTEYIQGPSGRIAAISTGTDPVAVLHGTSATHALQAQMFNTGSIAGIAGFLNHTTMSYIRNPSIAATGRALLWALLTAAVIMAFAVYTIRAARNRSWLGRLRANFAHRLADAAWFENNFAMQSKLAALATAGADAGGAYHQRRRRLLSGPATILAVTMLAMTMQCGSSNGGSNITIAPPGSNLFAFNFLLGPGGNGYGYPEEGTFYFQYNQVGSTSLVTDSAGKQAAYTVYKPFGEIHQDASDGRDIFRGKFNNNEYDRDGDVHFFNARYYDASIGSFLQADSLIYGANNYHAAGLNRYAFSGNNPVTYSDPGGNLFWFVPLIVAGAVAAAKAAAIGAITGAAISGIFYGVEVAFTGASWNWTDFGIAAGIGAATGALGGLASVAAKGALIGINKSLSAARKLSEKMITRIAGASGGFVEGASRSAITQQVENGSINGWTVFSDGLFGAVSGGASLRRFNSDRNFVTATRASEVRRSFFSRARSANGSANIVDEVISAPAAARLAQKLLLPDIAFGVFKRWKVDSY
ncbi:MAG: FG-GAP-like repeat-containing protein [bacterium]|nr:FG-GAP-like repeat-containing protein [bacterium]